MDRLYTKQWDNIIEILTENVNHSNLEIRKAAVYCLNYICEGLSENKTITIYE